MAVLGGAQRRWVVCNEYVPNARPQELVNSTMKRPPGSKKGQPRKSETAKNVDRLFVFPTTSDCCVELRACAVRSVGENAGAGPCCASFTFFLCSLPSYLSNSMVVDSLIVIIFLRCGARLGRSLSFLRFVHRSTSYSLGPPAVRRMPLALRRRHVLYRF